VMQYTHVEEDAVEAWKTLEPALVYSRRKYAEHADQRDSSDWDLETMSNERREQLRAGALVGNPEHAVERLREYEAKLPCELHFLARMWHPLLSFEEHSEAIELFGSDVISEFS